MKSLLSACAVCWVLSSGTSQAQSPPLPPGYAYQIAPISLTGSGYEFVSGGAIVRASNINGFNTAGTTVGYSSRYSSSGAELGVDTWSNDGSSTRLIGLIGPGYEYNGPDGLVRRNGGWQVLMGESGHAAGATYRFGAAGEVLGSDAWIFHGTSTQVIGPFGAPYEFTQPGVGVVRWNGVEFMRSSGVVAGLANRFTAAGEARGYDFWVFDGASTHTAGLTGGIYDRPQPGGVAYHLGEAKLFRDSGLLAGITHRWDSQGHQGGWDSWLLDGSATHVINPSGSAYDGTFPGSAISYHESTILDMNETGVVVGRVARFRGENFRGQDIWYHDGTVTQLIGFVGAGYEYTPAGGVPLRFSESQNPYHFDSEPGSSMLTENGTVVGYSARYSASGAILGGDAWLFNGTTTQQIQPLSGPSYQRTTPEGTIRASSPIAIDSSGRIIGVTGRYSTTAAVGNEGWIYDGTTVQLIGLTGADYEYTEGGQQMHWTSPWGFNPAGQPVGFAPRYSPSGADNGRDCWRFANGVTQRVGLTGEYYEFPSPSGGQYRYCRPTFESYGGNASGDMIGLNTRYSLTGEDRGYGAWFFDGQTGVTTELVFSVGPDGLAYTLPRLNRGGVVTGGYALFDGTTLLSRAFWWDRVHGFFDLGPLVAGGLAANAVETLFDCAGGAVGPTGLPPYLLAGGQAVGESTFGTVYRLTLDGCLDDPNKFEPGVCGCGVPEDPGDIDADGTPNCLDACPSTPHASPIGPSLRLTRTGSETLFEWMANDPAETWNVYSGTIVTPWAYNETCLAADLAQPSIANGSDPTSGQAFFYLVSAKTACGESPAGDGVGGEYFPLVRCP